MGDLRLKNEHAIAVVYVTSLFMASMDTQIVNVALPSLARDFRVPTASVQWVVTGYLLSIAVFIPASGWFGDRFGTKKILLIAIAVFTTASAMCALSRDIVELTLFRVLQGAGGGLLTPVGAAMLYRAYPPARRASLQPTLAIATIISPATAPVIGGLIVTKLSWHWIFLVNIPIGMASLIFGLVFLREHREAPRGRFDVTGFILSGAGLALVLYALSQGPVRGWLTPEVYLAGPLGLCALAGFVVSQLRSEHPLLRLRLFSDRSFRRSTITVVFSSAAFQGTLFAAPLYLQQGRGSSALVSGLTTFPEAIGVVVSAQFVRRTYPIIGPRRVVATGLTFMTAVLVTFAFVNPSTNLWIIRLLLFSVGLGVGQTNLPVQISAFAMTSTADTGHATAIFNTVRRAAPAMSVAILSTVLSSAGGHHLTPGPLAFRPVFIACASMAFAGILFALRIKDSDAAPSMRRREVPVPSPVTERTAIDVDEPALARGHEGRGPRP